jgi:hypothetical protein
MPNAFFKYLRRVVPVTKTTMIWNVHALKMNKNLQQNKKWLFKLYIFFLYLKYMKLTIKREKYLQNFLYCNKNHHYITLS